jgi:hypothetical protein
VADATLTEITRHETSIVGWGFALASLIILGLYLRHASRTVLMNIINAIKTGDVSTAPPGSDAEPPFSPTKSGKWLMCARPPTMR